MRIENEGVTFGDRSKGRGKRLGLVTNHTGVDLSLRSTAEILKEKYDLRFLAGPEHGVSGVAQAGVKYGDTVDPRTGLPVVSLFHGHDQPLSSQFPEVDMLVLDLQDVGLTRQDDFYTLDVPWVAPSPNLPTMESTLCYVGTCHMEGTNLSTGRGTTKLFELLGKDIFRREDFDPEAFIADEQAKIAAFLPNVTPYYMY